MFILYSGLLEKPLGHDAQQKPSYPGAVRGARYVTTAAKDMDNQGGTVLLSHILLNKPLEHDAKQNPLCTGARYVSTASENVDNQGGIVCLSDVNVILKIPGDALPPGDPVQISLTVDTNEEHPILQEDQLILGPIITCKPDGLKFLKPITLSVPHSGINISEHSLQVWCKQIQAVWEKIYDGSENQPADAVRVLVKENRIKFRVDHFTKFDFLTVPVSKLWNWLNPPWPEQPLEILVYMDPAEVATSRNVCLRVYAVKTTDAASKKAIENYEKENGESGMCCLPSGFVLKANGKNISVAVKNINPVQKWVPVDTMEGCITYTNIQNGGQAKGFPAARCEIMFLLSDNEDQADSFLASFDLHQDEDAESAVMGIYVTDREARRNRNRARNTAQDLHQVQNIPQEMNDSTLLPRNDFQPPHPQPTTTVAVQPPISDRSVRRKHYPYIPQVAASPNAQQLTQRLGRIALEQPITERLQNVPKDMEEHRASLASSQSFQANQQSRSTPSNTGGASYTQPSRTLKKRYRNGDDLRSLIVPCSLNSDQSAAASATPKQLDGDCGPFLKTMAREIVHRWKKVAKVLEFTPEQCEEFESNNSITESWWPAYRMLLKWKDKLPMENHKDFFKLLAEAIQTFDDEI